MATADNKQLYRRLIEEAFNEGDMDRVDDLVTDDVVMHEASQEFRGPEGAKEFLGTYRAAFPDATIHVDHLVAEGDTVAARWTATGTHDGDLMGIEPTGNEVTIAGMEMCRIEGDRIAEVWGVFDSLGMLQQLGAIPEDLSAAMPAADD